VPESALLEFTAEHRKSLTSLRVSEENGVLWSFKPEEVEEQD